MDLIITLIGIAVAGLVLVPLVLLFVQPNNPNYYADRLK